VGLHGVVQWPPMLLLFTRGAAPQTVWATGRDINWLDLSMLVCCCWMVAGPAAAGMHGVLPMCSCVQLKPICMSHGMDNGVQSLMDHGRGCVGAVLLVPLTGSTPSCWMPATTSGVI
jgi:hypothetical protein